MSSQCVSIDMRMMWNSGIGTYIRSLIPRIVEPRPDTRFRLLGNVDDLSKESWTTFPNIRIESCNSHIYSLREQFEIASKMLPPNEFYWSTHFNIPLFLRGRLIVTVHDVFHLAMPQFAGGPHKRLYARLMFSALKHRAEAVLCNSRFTADELVRRTGIDRQKIHVIHLGVGEEWFNCKLEMRPHPKPYLLYVGNVKPHKNLCRLIAAFESILDCIPHDLVIVGRKDGFITGDRIVAEKASALGNRVRFTGHVTSDLLQQYYLHADCFVFPSLYEGFGLPPLEAMACGCPVIASNAASLPEACGDAALYCDPLNPDDIALKIQSLTGDRDLQNDLRTKGIEHARLFSWDSTAVQTLAVLDKVIGKVGES